MGLIAVLLQYTYGILVLYMLRWVRFDILDVFIGMSFMIDGDTPLPYTCSSGFDNRVQRTDPALHVPDLLQSVP